MDMKPYQHGGDIYHNKGIVYDFSANINPLGLPPNVKEALREGIGDWEHYPDPECSQLLEKLSLWEGVSGRWILCGNGAADLIFRLALADQPRRALLLSPTFSEYEKALRSVDCEICYHALQEENGFLLTEAILEQIDGSIDMVVLCNPNNPTGQLIAPQLMARIDEKCRRLGIRLLVDECFLEFVQNGSQYSAKSYLAQSAGVVILKAFTKIFAMPGIRLGYLMTTDHALLRRMEALAQAWSVSGPAQTAGAAALENQEYVRKTQTIVAENRRLFSEGLRQLGFAVIPGYANYVLFKSEIELEEPLKQCGILIRRCDNYRGLPAGYYRAAVRTQRENQALLQALADLVK